MISRRHIAAAVCVVGTGLVGQPSHAAPGDTITATFEFTGEPQNFVVPADVTSIDVVACGAQGGDADNMVGVPIGIGGLGGQASSTISVTPGDELAVFVGGDGDAGGWNGGGIGGVLDPDINGDVDLNYGGGASDVRLDGDSLADRVVIGGGGGAGGLMFDFLNFDETPLAGWGGGGESGFGPYPGTQGGPGTYPGFAGANGALGLGGNGHGIPTLAFAGGGGGGLYGGAGGQYVLGTLIVVEPGSGGSGLGDSHIPAACAGDGWVEITHAAPPVSILPSGGSMLEGDSGSLTWQVPVRLSRASTESITVEWATLDVPSAIGIAESGTDFAPASGTVDFAPGQTEAFVPIEVFGDTDDESPLLWGEWGLIEFSNPTNAVIDTGPFFGLGLFIILDEPGDSPAP